MYFFFLYVLSLASDSSWNLDNLACYSKTEPEWPAWLSWSWSADLNSVLNNLPNIPYTYPSGRELEQSYFILQRDPSLRSAIDAYQVYRGNRTDAMYFCHYFNQAKSISLNAGALEHSNVFNDFIFNYTNHYMDLLQREHMNSGWG